MCIPMKPFKYGFTLIEILIALMVFAILATITSSSLYNVFNTKARIQKQADRLEALQVALSIIQQETIQVLDRPVRGNDMQLYPGFIGQANYVEFTTDGNLNPQSLEKRSTLDRIALVCENGQLIRRSWNVLDPVDRKLFEDKVLLNDLTACHFNYLNQNLQVLSEWREQAVTQDQVAEPLPKAIQVNISLKDWGEMNLLFIIPGALYV